MLGLKTRRWLVLGSVLVPTLCIVVWSCLFGYMAVIHAQHRNWYEHVEARILALAERRPQEIAPSQWAYYIACTWNLHSNLGTAMKFESSARNGFLAEFDSRLNRHVDRGTIDWIWDQYEEHSQGGRDYSRRYRPTSCEMLGKFSDGELGAFEIQHWVDELNERRANGTGSRAMTASCPVAPR